MRKLSVTEYLIAQNQAQTTVTTYARFGAAVDAIAEQAYSTHPENGVAVRAYEDGPFDGVAPNDTDDGIGVYEVYATEGGGFDVGALGYVAVWRMIDGRVTYTIHNPQE